ncbi:MAG: hypothetical protein ACYC3X_04135 [Pirellulaceae bacterium]
MSLLLLSPNPVVSDEPLFRSAAVEDLQQASDVFNHVLLGNSAVEAPLGSGTIELIADPAGERPHFLVTGQQVGMSIKTPIFLTPATRFTWSWKKEEGAVCIVQLQVQQPETGQRRYLGYAAGTWKEPTSADPTVEFFVAADPPRQWSVVERNLYDDVHTLLGWDSAQVTEFYASPWEGSPARFRDATVTSVTARDVQSDKRQRQLQLDSQVGKGAYQPLRVKGYDEKRVDVFDSSFEECAPGRNSAANEWSAFGAIGNMDFNAMGRDMHVRYPAFDLVFRLDDGQREIKPDALASFRLGLVEQRLPAIWGGWEHNGLLYKVSVMTVPSADNGNFDLYKLQVQNSTSAPISSQLAATLEGPPDMRVEQGVVRGLGAAPFLIVDPEAAPERTFRDWGLCDKRAKAYGTGGGPGKTEPAVASYRTGLDGLPVQYRFKAEPTTKYLVYLVSTPHIGGYLLEQPKQPGDLVFEYKVEGLAPQTLDWVQYLAKQQQPLCVRFDGAQDTDGDGYITVCSGVAEHSRIRHTRLSVIYVLPQGTNVPSDEAIYSGTMNAQCVWHIDVGATPEQGSINQDYDKSDLGFARLKLRFAAAVPPHTTCTYWLRVPPIHRRQPVSMGYMAHAFRDVLPGEAVPPFAEEQVRALQSLSPDGAEQVLRDYWQTFFARATRFELPDPILNDIFLSRLATRAILDVPITKDVVYNTCSPYFYFDHAYRDQAYVIYALDLAKLHDQAERLLRVYCMDVEAVPPGPIAFDGKPLQLGMLPNGLWNTRPGQFDTQGQNIWALVQHYKLSGDLPWLAKTAYPYVRRGAMWIVNSRQKHMQEVKDPEDPRYGLIEPGGMEVLEVGAGMHMYYMNGFAILGLREAADAARAVGAAEDCRLFTQQGEELQASLHKSFVATFKRTALYEGQLWFGVEPQGVGMYGFWAHNCLLWPCRCLDPHDPMLSATWRRLERMSNTWGGGMHSEGQGSFWPYIGVDRAVSYLLRGEPERALDYFCAFTDTAGGTLSWGEGYANVIAAGDQPHFWADAQWVNLFRQLFVFEDGADLWITPATFHRWQEAGQQVSVAGLTTHFGDLDLQIQPDRAGTAVEYRITVSPKGDQATRPLDKIILYPRLPGGRTIRSVSCDDQPVEAFTRDSVIIARPERGKTICVQVDCR